MIQSEFGFSTMPKDVSQRPSSSKPQNIFHIRYAGATAILICYLLIFFYQDTQSLVETLNVDIPKAVISLVLISMIGLVIYWVYRFIIFDFLIVWIRDCIFKNTYRNFLKSRYDLGGGRYSMRATREAHLLFYSIQIMELKSDYLRAQATGIHLLYIAGILALIFFVVTLGQGNHAKSIIFGLLSILFVVGLIGNQFQETQELHIIKRNLKPIDSIASVLGKKKRQ